MKQKKILLPLFAMLTLAIALLAAPSMKAKAASITQTSIEPTAVTITWTKPVTSYNQLSYTLRVGSDYNAVKTAPGTTLGANTTSYKITGLQPGSSYAVRLEYTYKTSSGGPYSSYYTAYIATMPSKVTNVYTDTWYYYAKSAYMKWDPQSGVSGYEYIVKVNGGAVAAQGSISYNSSSPNFSFDINNSNIYTVQVRAYTDINNSSAQRYYGEWSDVHYAFHQPMIKKAKKSNGKLTLKWNKISGATRYVIYMSTKKNSGYKKVKTLSAKKSSYTIKKFKGKKIQKKKKYYVYILAQKQVGANWYNSAVNYCTWIK